MELAKIKIAQADITELNVDAIVNAANSSLMGGGGVDGAIHKKAGPQLLEECKTIRKTKYQDGLPKGEAVITKGYNLPAKYVIHTVGPIYHKDNVNLLKDCYINSLKLAEENNCASIAFPAISTGAYAVPIEVSAKIVKETLKDYKSNVIVEIMLVLHSKEDYSIYNLIIF